MKLNDFTNGINTLVDPSLLGTTFAVVSENVDVAAGPLMPVKAPTTTKAVTGKYVAWYDAKDVWVESTTVRDYLEYQGVMYWTQPGEAQQYNGTVTTKLGITAPANQPIVATSGTGRQDGVYQYMYSYYNDLTGIESSVSPLSVEISLTGVGASVSYLASTDPQVTHIRIYRIGGTWTDFLLLATVANVNGTYIDAVADEDLQGALVGTSLNNPPPTDLRFITEQFGMFFGAVGTKLYYGRGDGYPQYWPAINYFELFEPITSIAAITDGILIFTKTSTTLLTGRDALSFMLYPLDKTKGCINHAATVSLGNTALVVGTNGIYAASMSGVKALSQPILGDLQLSTVNAVVLNEIYYLQLANGKILCYDFRFGKNSFYYLDFDTEYLATDYTYLYGVQGTNLVKLFSNGLTSYTYKTGVITEGEYSTVKSYNKFYVRSNGDLTMKIYIDGALVLTKVLSGNELHEVTPPQYQRKGYGMELEFTGTGIVYEVITTPTPREL